MYDVKLPNIDWLGQRGDLDRMFATDPSTEQGLILFYGASNFTRWSTRWKHRALEDDIRRKDGSRACVNHGFGTSTAEELLYYYPRLVKPWKPRAMVLSCGMGNSGSAGYTAPEVMMLTARVLDWARHDFPGIRLYLYLFHPSPSSNAEARRKSGGLELNGMMERYCRRHEDVILADARTYPAFWQEGHMGDYDYPRPELYVEDGVHFNQAGYDVYRDYFLQLLDDIL